MSAPCGTPQGYNRHRNGGERPCQDCYRAQADYIRSRRILAGTGIGVHVTYRVLGLLLCGHPDALRQAVVELGQRTVDAAKTVSARPVDGAA
jgi:hypothetical protein